MTNSGLSEFRQVMCKIRGREGNSWNDRVVLVDAVVDGRAVEATGLHLTDLQSGEVMGVSGCPLRLYYADTKQVAV